MDIKENIKLSYRVGDSLYTCNPFSREIQAWVITDIQNGSIFSEDDILFHTRLEKVDSNVETTIRAKDIGKTLYRTKEEAEKGLSEWDAFLKEKGIIK